MGGRTRWWRWGALAVALPLGFFVGGFGDRGEEVAPAAPAVVAARKEALAAPTVVAAGEESPEPSTTVLASASTPAPKNVISSQYHPRPEGEWQGMQVNLALRATCEESEGCGLAMACRDGLCGPCEADEHCAGGEVCVLDHCVPTAQASCRRRADCGEGELCVLSGYSGDERNNRELRATCLAGRGGEPERPGR